MPIWAQVNGAILNQGDLLSRITFPEIRPNFPEEIEGRVPIDTSMADAIVLSQSCDLQPRSPLRNVILAQIFSVAEFEEANPAYKKKDGRWGHVAKGRVEALHLLRSPEAPDEPRAALVVDFRTVVSLPFSYVQRTAEVAGDRWRLLSPYLEDLSQRFGTFFMRVALPTDPIALK